MNYIWFDFVELQSGGGPYRVYVSKSSKARVIFSGGFDAWRDMINSRFYYEEKAASDRKERRRFNVIQERSEANSGEPEE